MFRMRAFVNCSMTNHKVDLLLPTAKYGNARATRNSCTILQVSLAVNIERYRRCALHYRSKLSLTSARIHMLLSLNGDSINFEAQSVRLRVKRLVFSMGSVRTWPAGPARSGKQQEIAHEAGGQVSAAADCVPWAVRGNAEELNCWMYYEQREKAIILWACHEE